MRAYVCETTEGFEATIFADCFEGAAERFCTHHETMLGRMPGEFTIGVVRRPKPGMKRRHLVEALERGIAGVGYYMAGRGWSIVPAEISVGFIPQ